MNIHSYGPRAGGAECEDIHAPRRAGRSLHETLPTPKRSCRCRCLSLAGCAVGPNFHRPQAPKDAGYTVAPLPDKTTSTQGPSGDAQHLALGRDVDYRWWETFGSPGINSLVERAFRVNPSVRAAQASLRQAQEMVYAQQGYFWPSVGADYNFERQKLPGNTATSSAPGIQGNGQVLVPSAPAQPLIYNFQTAQLTVGFVPDVFGENRRKVESLDAQAQNATLRARGDLHQSCLERRGRGDPGGFDPRPVEGNPRDHRAQREVGRHPARQVRAGLRERSGPRRSRAAARPGEVAAAAAAEAIRAEPRLDPRAGGQFAGPGRLRDVRAHLPEVAHGAAALPAFENHRAASRHPRRGGGHALGECERRRGGRRHAAAIHHHRVRRAERRRSSARCSPGAGLSGR